MVLFAWLIKEKKLPTPFLTSMLILQKFIISFMGGSL